MTMTNQYNGSDRGDLLQYLSEDLWYLTVAVTVFDAWKHLTCLYSKRGRRPADDDLLLMVAPMTSH